MNTPNYEKAYKEALERAKSFQDKYGGDYAGYIFPELRESEDERIRKELIEFILWVEDRGLTRQDFYQGKRPGVWLAWLQKQKEQKPVEWSDEDKEILDGLISLYSNTYSGEKWPWKKGGYITYGDVVNFLKSLRPSWKPSEGQMEALQNAVALSAGNKVLAGLYDQLKAIKEDGK